MLRRLRLPRLLLLPLLLIVLNVLVVAPARASFSVSPRATRGDFEAFHRRFSSDAYFYPRHSAAPLGLIGFEVYADATYDDEFDDQSFNQTAVDGSYTGGFLSVARVGARKGLPGGVDVGLAYGKTLNGDVKLISAELQYAILHGGLLEPALSVRVTGTRTVDATAYELNQYGADVLLSKGFTVLTPYIGAGLIRSRGRLDRGLLGTFEDTETHGVAFAGVTLNLLLPKINFEVEKGEALQGAVRVGFGF
ncbi:MAG TPA: hypothetical protein VLX28_14960 [Thermoanaerobaculia bacterium]|nr:hypothetical protein [Thermoanaerobaculia bacterium]